MYNHINAHLISGNFSDMAPPTHKEGWEIWYNLNFMTNC